MLLKMSWSEISCSHGSKNEEYNLLGYGTVQSHRSRLIFQRWVLPQSIWNCSKHFWTVSQFLPDYIAQHPREQSSSLQDWSHFSPRLWGLPISHLAFRWKLKMDFLISFLKFCIDILSTCLCKFILLLTETVCKYSLMWLLFILFNQERPLTLLRNWTRYEIWGSHSIKDFDVDLLQCNTTWTYCSVFVWNVGVYL
jgi:hypothetical protein